MKRWKFLLRPAIVFMLLLLNGCAPTGQTGAADKLQVVTTIFPPYDFVRNIAGDKVGLTMLLKPGAESHTYEPSPQDIIKIQNCKIFIYTGGESDEWVNKILASMHTGSMKIIRMMDCVPVVTEELVEGMEEEEEESVESAEPEYDEHIWTSPRNAKLIVQKISGTLCAIDTPNAAVYQQNTRDYLAKLDALDAGFRAVINKAVRKTIVLGDRFPFRYLADAYGLKYYAAFPGCATETEASAATVKFLIDKARAEKIPVIFHMEFSNRKMAEAISEAAGAKVRLLHSIHNVSKKDLQKGAGYLELMQQNIQSLAEALH